MKDKLMDFGIRGKRALVCGASKGLGKATAFALAEEGVSLFLCSRSEETLSATAAEIQAQTQIPVTWMPCDLADQIQREQMIQRIQETYGGLDILIHNTGGPKPSRVEDTSIEAWTTGFENLFLSIVHLNQAFLPAMKQQEWGRIIAITSISVVEPVPNLAVSNAMRAAVTGMLKTLSDEVASHNVCINCVAPGVIHTDRTEERIQHQIQQKGGTRQAYLDEYLRSIPAGRLGKPEECASLIAFLCSQQAAYINGSTFLTDGGKRRATY
jgi:3-oxoacyl-[acyl-carrier protein] reductase